jgi:hypothetical protein
MDRGGKSYKQEVEKPGVSENIQQCLHPPWGLGYQAEKLRSCTQCFGVTHHARTSLKDWTYKCLSESSEGQAHRNYDGDAAINRSGLRKGKQSLQVAIRECRGQVLDVQDPSWCDSGNRVASQQILSPACPCTPTQNPQTQSKCCIHNCFHNTRPQETQSCKISAFSVVW